MTKIEKNKCEKLCLEAISEMQESNELYDKDFKENRDAHFATVELRRADNKRGFAEGMYQVLVSIGYKSDSMKKLYELIME